MKTTILAIDPGATGGIALQQGSDRVTAYAMPDTEGDVLNLLRSLVPDPANSVAVIEEVGGYVGKIQPGSSMFTFGRGFGFLLGVLQALGVRVELVRPQKWQKALGLGTSRACATKSAWKNKLKSEAQRLYPAIKVTLSNCDALLILEYRAGQEYPRGNLREVAKETLQGNAKELEP